MAAFLNKPDDFANPVPSEMSQPQHTELHPPSMFQSTKPPDPWKDLAKVSQEILELRKETQNLRNKDNAVAPSTQTHIKEPVDTSYFHRYTGPEEFKYANELISRQSKEILDLKNEIQRLTDKHRLEIRTTEDQLVEKERYYTSRLTSLENMLQRKEENYDQEIDRLSFEHEKTTEAMTERINNLTEELHQLKIARREREEELTTKLKSCEEESKSTVEHLKDNLREKEKDNGSLIKQVQQLKSYIGETEKSHRPTEVWRKENDTLSNKLQICEADRENLKSTIDLLNVRLTAMGEILAVQEAEISKSKLGVIDKKNLENILLTRWREKVFALMVQNKSSEIYVKKNVDNWKMKYLSLQSQLQSSERQTEILQHQISEKTAQINLEKINSKKALEELAQTQQVAVTLDNQMIENTNHLQLLKSVSESVDNHVADTVKKISTSLSMLKSYGERISFASSRVDLLQGQMARKDALLKLEGKVEVKDIDIDSTTSDHILVELQKVTRERDFVTNQLKQVSQTLNDKIQENKQQYENEIITLKKTVEDLQICLQNKSQAFENLSERLEDRELEREEMNERLESLSKELGRQKNMMEQAIEDQKIADEETMRQEMVELEKQVNQARREQTKAVVALRHIERQSLREKERLNEQITLSDSHYNKQIERLQQQLKSIEKERNMMMATLRQEGLMSKVKQDRGEPIIFVETNKQTEEPTKSQEKEDEVTEETVQPKSNTEAMSDVIEDLKSLAAVIVDDNNSDSDDSMS
ncbi:coiled-coil alpha-helical rod protein 1 isoform X1 [Patella vulgata]|uniref:coiled-coil alpha-helical rod protein 1 isoform X1 n=2 Tax=Patella vulgata TaxID=6465 RepID=UPI00217FEE8F|nr:coiled-coil alpha-helical rod protein 1 isoform X1 [Patella vulgata]